MFATVLVEVLDAAGEETNRTVPVHLEYMQTAESYGSDADGRRGTVLVSYEVTDSFTDAVLLAEEEAQVLRDAEERFLENPERYAPRANVRVGR